jgi:hypothetical protein
VLVSTVDLRNLVAEAAGRASLCCERPTRNGRRRFAAKLPECPSTESSRWVGRRSDFRTTNGCLLVSGFHQQFLICVGRIHQIFWPAHQEGQPLRRRRVTKFVTKLIAVGPFLFPYRSTRGRTGRVATIKALLRRRRHYRRSSQASASSRVVRKSRFACEVSTSNTRFFLSTSGIGAESCDASSRVFIMTPTGAWHGLKHLPICAPLPDASAVHGYAAVVRSSACAPMESGLVTIECGHKRLLSLGLVVNQRVITTLLTCLKYAGIPGL